jgi:ribosomal protein S18 acetylase RimI-like enzyme
MGQSILIAIKMVLLTKISPQPFRAMTERQIEFYDRKQDVDLQQLQLLFNAYAFWAKGRSIEDLQIMIDHSEPTISMWDNQKLIGFARATSDGIYRAMIWDVVINETYRGLGLGRRLVETLVHHPKLTRVERVYLTTSHQQNFYERLGFVRNDTATMILDRCLAAEMLQSTVTES